MSGCGALLTPYKLPDECFQPTFTTSSEAFLATDPGCFPSACNGGYYSPGVCPMGWNTYTTWTTNWPSPRPKTGETAYGCCFGALTGQNSNMACAGYITASAGVTIDSQNSTRTTSFALSTISVSAYDLKIRNQDSDTGIFSAALAARTSSSMSSTSSKSSSSTESVRPTSTVSPSPTTAPTPASLSTGTKAAIGVAVPIVVIALFVGIFIFFRRRGQQKRMAGEEALPGAVNRSFGSHSSAHASEKFSEYPPSYPAPRPPHPSGTDTMELYGQHLHPQEMDSVQPPVEVPADPVTDAYLQASDSPDTKKSSHFTSPVTSPVSAGAESQPHDRYANMSPVSERQR
ncbi:MAG: hypothetical protein M1814_001779 [Vezdaea aestivalis]|nr:MAG: hypothetical protein M1814_001779 [Vezdaea aestivalis]